jgi:hypothetical protein
VAVAAGVPETEGGVTAVSLAVGGVAVLVVEEVETLVPSDEVPSPPPPQADRTKVIAAHMSK